MFDLNQFIEGCKGKTGFGRQAYLVEEALRDPSAVRLALTRNYPGAIFRREVSPI